MQESGLSTGTTILHMYIILKELLMLVIISHKPAGTESGFSPPPFEACGRPWGGTRGVGVYTLATSSESAISTDSS